MACLINSISLQLLQLSTSLLLFKTGSSKRLLYSSGILSLSKIVLNNVVKKSTALSPL